MQHPTAGLHFDERACSIGYAAIGVKIVDVTLRIGIGTFFLVKSETVEGHEMHREYYSVPADRWRPSGRRKSKEAGSWPWARARCGPWRPRFRRQERRLSGRLYRSLHLSGLHVQGRRRPHHEFPSSPVDAPFARVRVRREGGHRGGLPRGYRAALSVLQLRGCDVYLMSAFRVLTSVGLARLAILETNHAAIETPVFMPVGTQGAVKALLARDLEEMGAQIVLGNAYHLYLRPGDVLVKEMGGIQRFAGWDGAVLTDSGGYQIFSLGLLRKIQEEGVTFQSHIDGSKHFLTPERVVESTGEPDADICMCLDECVNYPSSHDYTKASMGLTTRWAAAARTQRRVGHSSSALSRAGCTGI